MYRTCSKITVFVVIVMCSILTSSSKVWASSVISVLHEFDGTGYSPSGDLIVDSAGNIYGATNSGGLINANCNPTDCGVVFEFLNPVVPGHIRSSTASPAVQTRYSDGQSSARRERKPLWDDIGGRDSQ
jgi:hypothetical protein